LTKLAGPAGSASAGVKKAEELVDLEVMGKPPAVFAT